MKRTEKKPIQLGADQQLAAIREALKSATIPESGVAIGRKIMRNALQAAQEKRRPARSLFAS